MHIYNINFEEKSVETKEETFEKFEDLLKCYREKKQALFAECINYNTDFEVYIAILKKQDIKKLDEFLQIGGIIMIIVTDAEGWVLEIRYL